MFAHVISSCKNEKTFFNEKTLPRSFLIKRRCYFQNDLGKVSISVDVLGTIVKNKKIGQTKFYYKVPFHFKGLA